MRYSIVLGAVAAGFFILVSLAASKIVPVSHELPAGKPSATPLVVEARAVTPTTVVAVSPEVDPTSVPTASPTSVSGSALAVSPTVVPTPTPTFPSVVRAERGGPSVHTAPDSGSSVLSGLYFDTYLRIDGERRDSAGALWYRVQLWGALTGWIRADQTVTGDPTPRAPFYENGGTPSKQASTVTPSVSMSLDANGVTDATVNLRDAADVSAGVVDILGSGVPVHVSAWQTDGDGQAWYHVQAVGESGWIFSKYVDLNQPPPSTVVVDGEPIWSGITGKGMWLPTPLLQMADPHAIVAAALGLGLTHVYVEAGGSGRGFYGRGQIDRLLPVAHGAGLKVIGWITTGLYNLPSDVALSETIANYRTPSGDRLDGIAPDIEQNMTTVDVKAYSQILRARLGNQRLIVGVLYPAGGWFGQNYPIQGVVAQSFNAIAPMAYWSDHQRQYTPSEVATYVAKVVRDMHAAVGDSNYPVQVIGQTYDTFGPNGTGVYNPSGAEITAALGAAKEAGAVGISFFQWATATPTEWDAIRQFRWAGG